MKKNDHKTVDHPRASQPAAQPFFRKGKDGYLSRESHLDRSSFFGLGVAENSHPFFTNAPIQTKPTAKAIRSSTKPYIAKAPLDYGNLDLELTYGLPLTQTQGEIGFGATRGKKKYPPAEDKTLPIKAFIFQSNTTTPATHFNLHQGAGAKSGTGAAANPAKNSTDPAALKEKQKRQHQPKQKRAQVVRAGKFGIPIIIPTMGVKRAMIISGIHGDERGALDLVNKLLAELRDKTHPLSRDFDVMVIPNLNPGGIADWNVLKGNKKANARYNRRGVDLNRNFPGIKGFPPATGKVPRQPEVKSVMEAVQKFRPDRILVLHAISSKSKGGIYADPVEGRARELACRMALLSRGQFDSKTGKFTGEINVRGNKLNAGVCNSRYPGAPPKITSTHTSLGNWASGAKALGGMGTTVITHEVSEDKPLKATGPGRSVETLMPGIREFLLDNTAEPSVADALLAKTVNKAFLMGKNKKSTLKAAIVEIVKKRFKDLDYYYQKSWYPAQPRAIRKKLPRKLGKPVSHYRSFKDQANIVKGQLKRRKITSSSSQADIEAAIKDILSTRSMPGFSRHHWGTEIDVVSATKTKWETGGKYAPLIPFLREEATKFGFFHPYSNAYPALNIKGFPIPTNPHYAEEPWHLSYWEIANVLQKEWESTFQGPDLDKLIAETAKAIAVDKKKQVHLNAIEQALKNLQIDSYQKNVNPSP